VFAESEAREKPVVEGPPGTGKFTIDCELGFRNLADRGKKVLVVSQKRAALDVVLRWQMPVFENSWV